MIAQMLNTEKKNEIKQIKVMKQMEFIIELQLL